MDVRGKGKRARACVGVRARMGVRLCARVYLCLTVRACTCVYVFVDFIYIYTVFPGTRTDANHLPGIRVSICLWGEACTS